MSGTNPADMIPALDAIIASSRITITEVEFRNSYLGLFAPREWTEPVPMVIWVDKVSKTPFNEVYVLDDKKNVLFVVPPILDPSDDVLLPILQSGKRVALISNEAQVQADRIPKLGEIHFQTHLTNKVRQGKVKPEYIGAWNKIFSFYKLPLLRYPQSFKHPDGSVRSPSLNEAISDGANFNNPDNDESLSENYVDL